MYGTLRGALAGRKIAFDRETFTATVDGRISGIGKTIRIKSIHVHYDLRVPRLARVVAGGGDGCLPGLRGMRGGGGRVFASSAAWRAARGDPRDLNFWALLAEFGRLRAETVALLRGLDDAGWQRRGTSPSRGPLTIEQYARSMAEHDREHLEQFEKTRARIEARP